MMRVFSDRRAQAGVGSGLVTNQAQRIAGKRQVRGVLVAVYLMTIEAAHSAVVHHALREIVTLHAVLMRGAVGVVEETWRPQANVFQIPMICEPLTGKKSYWPVVVFSCNGIGRWLFLAVTLNAHVVASHKIKPLRIHNIGRIRMLHVLAASTVTLLAADIPLDHLLGCNVVVHRMASIAQRPGRPFHIAYGIEGNPPICACRDMIRKPALVLDVPLRRQRIEVLAAFREIALLPPAAIDEGDVIQAESSYRIRMSKTTENRLGMNFWIADYVGHARLLPSGILLG